MQISEVFSSRQVHLVPSHKGNATLISTLQVHPWFQPASATRFMLQEPVIAFWIFQRKRKNNMDRFECFLQVRAGTMQGNNCFLYFHFSHYQGQWAKSSSQILKHLVDVCKCVLVLPLQPHCDWRRTRVTHKLSFIRSQVTKKQKVTSGTGLILLSRSLLLPLHYSEHGNRRCQRKRWTPRQRAHFQLRLRWKSHDFVLYVGAILT